MSLKYNQKTAKFSKAPTYINSAEINNKNQIQEVPTNSYHEIHEGMNVNVVTNLTNTPQTYIFTQDFVAKYLTISIGRTTTASATERIVTVKYNGVVLNTFVLPPATDDMQDIAETVYLENKKIKKNDILQMEYTTGGVSDTDSTLVFAWIYHGIN